MARGDVLVVGNGAREHALVWKLRQSPHVKKIYAAQGNAGTAEIAANIDIEPTNIPQLCCFAREKEVELTVVGPEMPLKLGIVDLFQQYKLGIFGPTAAAARIETSKLYAKEIMFQEDIPTAHFRSFSCYEKAYAHIHERSYPLVIKADGLAAGKGAYVCKDRGTAIKALNDLMVSHIYGSVGDKILIEDFLEGEEVSIHALCHGTTAIPLPVSRDYKLLNGKNTGGMGAYAPVPRFTHADMLHVKQKVISPLLRTLNKRETPFLGCLYPGIMLTVNGPFVLEYNARFGDPETQVLMALLESDLFLLLRSIIDKKPINPVFAKNTYAVCVVLASKEYPLPMHNPVPIYGVEEALELWNSNTLMFHGATRLVDNQLYTSGGRPLSAVGIGESLQTARIHAYQLCDPIEFHGKQMRDDIGI